MHWPGPVGCLAHPTHFLTLQVLLSCGSLEMLSYSGSHATSCILVRPQVHLGIAGPTAYYVMWMTGYNTVSFVLAAHCPTLYLCCRPGAAAGCRQACGHAATHASDRLCRACEVLCRASCSASWESPGRAALHQAHWQGAPRHSAMYLDFISAVMDELSNHAWLLSGSVLDPAGKPLPPCKGPVSPLALKARWC